MKTGKQQPKEEKQQFLDVSVRDDHGHVHDGFKFIFGGGLDLADGGSTVLIEGQAGIGKTVLALQMAICFFDNSENSDKYVLYVSLEQPGSSLKRLLANFNKFGRKVGIVGTEEYHMAKCVPGKLNILSRPSVAKLDDFIDTIATKVTDKCGMLLLDSIGVYERSGNGAKRDQLDRLCALARQMHYALIMVREKEPLPAEEVAEYVTDTVFELQFKPMSKELPYGPLVRTMEVKKSRVQKSHRGPHEFEIIDRLGLVVYPSCASVFQHVQERQQKKPLSPAVVAEKYIDVLGCKEAKVLHEQLIHKEETIDRSGLRLGQSLLLFAAPGSLKTAVAFDFLRLALKTPDENCLFLTFKIDERSLETVGVSYLGETEYRRCRPRLKFIDARQTFWTPARVLAEVRKEVTTCNPKEKQTLRRAAVFGVGMIDRLPAFKGMEMTFLQVLTSYFDSEDISAVFVEWPQQATIQELRFDSIVNYFATAIEWIDRESTEEEEKCYIRVVRHDFRVVRNDPLCIVETKKDSPRRLSIRVLDGEKGDKSKEELDEGKRVGCPLGLDSSRGSRPTAFEA